MIKRTLVISFIVIVSALAHAQDSSSALNQCHNKIKSVGDTLKISIEDFLSDDLGQCLANFVTVNNPKEHVLLHETDNSCGFICSSRFSILNRTYDADDYYELLEEKVGKEDIAKVEKLTGALVKEMVYTEYQKIADFNEKRAQQIQDTVDKEFGNRRKKAKARIRAKLRIRAKEYGLPLLKSIIFEYAKLSLEAQLIELKIDQVFEVKGVAEHLFKNTKDCLDIATTEDGLKMCTDKIQENAAYTIGRYTLDVNLEQNFKERLPWNKYQSFRDSAVNDYDICAVNYYFNSSEKSEEVADKIQPCVYNGLLESFLKIAENLVLENSKMTPIEVKLVVIDLVDKCGPKPLASASGNRRLRLLQKVSADDFTEYLLSCQKSLTVGVVERVGVTAIAEHKSVVGILGGEGAKTFAEQVIKEEIPVCFKKLGTESEPEKCENYLFAKTSSKLFPTVIEKEFKAVQKEFSFLSDELIQQSIQGAQSKLSSCEEEMFQDFRAFSSRQSDEAEVETAKCLRVGILGSLEKVVEAYVKAELQNNEILKENGIVFGLEKRNELKTDFFSCAALNIETSKGLSSVIETSSTFLDKCVLSLTQGVVADTFKTIVYDKLFEVSLKSDQIAVVYTDYQEDPGNLVVAVSNAKSLEEIEKILRGAERKIISSISQNVIKFLIVNKSPVKFESDVIVSLSKIGSEALKKCLLSEELSVCADKIELIVVEQALDIFLPAAIYDVFKEKLSDLISEKEFEKLGLKQRIESSLNTTEDGKALKKFIVSEIEKQTSIEEIQEMKQVNDFVIKHIYSPISKSLIRTVLVKKSPIKFPKATLDSLVKFGGNRIDACLETKSISDCTGDLESALTKKAVESFLPQAAYDEVRDALKGVLTKSEIQSYGLLSKIKTDIRSSREGKKLIVHISKQISRGVSVDKIKSDSKIVAYITDVAIEPIASDILKKLITKKSPIKFGKGDMNTLVSTGKSSLIKCLKKGNTSVCADRAEKAVLKKAVVVYLPKAVNDECKKALSDWFAAKEINSYGLISKFSQSLTTGKVGQEVASYIASELGKGVGADRLQKRSKVTSYIYLVLSTYKAPGKSGRMIVDDIAHRIIQKEINKFLAEIRAGKHNFFFGIGFNIHFAGKTAKTAFKWSNSKRTKSGKKATAKFKSIFKNVVEKGASISDKDIEKMKELVKDAVLEYRNAALAAERKAKGQ